MLTIILNSIREKIRNKTMYIVGIIGGSIVIFLMLNADFTYDNKEIVSFEELLPFAIIMVSFLACMLAITLSLQTIPKEFENKTSHLILVRGIKPYQYMLGLVLSNIITSLMSLFILYMSIIIFCILKGGELHVLRIMVGMLIMAINVTVISAITSFLSINLPLAVNGMISVLIYFLGSFHNIIATYARTVGGAAGAIFKTLLMVIPDIHAIGKQAGQWITGKPVQLFPIISQVFFFYMVITLILFNSKREV